MKKSPWRFLFAAAAAYGGAKLLGLIWVWFNRNQVMFTPGEAASIGIIGGADGPAAIFVTAPMWVSYILPVVLMIVGIWGFLRLRKCKK